MDKKKWFSRNKDMWLRKCSVPLSDVEAAAQKSKRDQSDDVDDEVIITLKKQRKEIDEITTSLKEMSETLQENSLTKAFLEDILLKLKETPNKKVEQCCFEIEGAEENYEDTILVRGFDCSFPRKDIESTLRKHFDSCGKITRVFVPIECKTGSPLGFAFIDLKKKPDKALKLNDSELGGLKLQVVMAKGRLEYRSYPNFHGCQRCGTYFHQRRFRKFYETHRMTTSDSGEEDFDEEDSDEEEDSDDEKEEDSDEEEGDTAIVTNHS